MRAPRGLPSPLADLGRTVVMAVLNVTPDSFSDGGRFVDADLAVEHGLALVAQGADLVDVGGESTRPGARRIPVPEELDRVIPVVGRLAAAGAVVSVDTTRAEVARAALDCGASLINDVSGGLADPAMVELLAEVDVAYVAMHWRGHSADMDVLARYDDVVAEVCQELAGRLAALESAGVDPARVILDPGLGFAKTPAHNWQILRGLDRLEALGRPLLLGASRKRFLGELLADGDAPRPVDQRDRATDAVTALAAARGVWGVRVHDVAGSRDAVAVAGAWPTSPAARDRPGPGPGATGHRGSPAGDQIVLTGVRARGHHGVLEHERAEGQEFVVDVVLDVGSVAEAARHDDLDRTVDYGVVAEAITRIVAGRPVDLIETLAETLAGRCLSFAGVQQAQVTVHKPQAPIPVPFGDVAVRITRQR